MLIKTKQNADGTFNVETEKCASARDGFILLLNSLHSEYKKCQDNKRAGADSKLYSDIKLR